MEALVFETITFNERSKNVYISPSALVLGCPANIRVQYPQHLRNRTNSLRENHPERTCFHTTCQRFSPVNVKTLYCRHTTEPVRSGKSNGPNQTFSQEDNTCSERLKWKHRQFQITNQKTKQNS